jgi:low affinity Fe/Cu permease
MTIGIVSVLGVFVIGLFCVVFLQKKVIEDLQEQKRSKFAARGTMLSELERKLDESQRAMDQIALVMKILEWRKDHDIEDFNELVAWELAEELDIDRTVASAIYDKIIKAQDEQNRDEY